MNPINSVRSSYRRWFGLLLLVALLAASLSGARSTLAATTWYVDTGGSNGNDGSYGSPLATLQEAVNRASPGDTIVVRAGTYNVSQAINIDNKHGSSSAVLTIQGEGMPTIKAPTANDIPVWSGIITISSSSFVNVQGIRLENSGWFGFKATDSDNIGFYNNQSSISLASAIYVYNSAHISVFNNDVSRFCDQQESVRGSSCQEGISVVKTDDFNVSNNTVHDAPEGDGTHPGGGEGIDAKEGSTKGIIAYNHVYNLVQLGIYVDAWNLVNDAIHVYGNRVHNTANGIAVNSEAGGTVKNVNIHDNVVYNTGYHGIILDSAGQDGLRQNIHIYNNTIYHTGYTAYKPPYCVLYGCGDWGYGIYINTSNLSGISIHDNIAFDSQAAQLSLLPAAASAVSVNTNILYPQLNNSWANETFGSNAIIADPLFVNPSSNDFHLQSGSPAIGVGIGGDPLDHDADYVQRPSWPIDLGAFVHQ